MKIALIALALLSLEEQTAIVEKISNAGIVTHHSVSSLTKIMKHQPLDGTEISYLYGCVNTPKVCSLFTIELEQERIWVFMDPATGRYDKISQTVYSE